jgi:cell division protein FtsZ
MTINLHLPVKTEMLRPTITVVGVGGAGGNAVNNMIAADLEGVNFVVSNTDAQALEHSLTERTIQLGAGITKGLGAGANPEVGRAAAEEAKDEISAYIEGSNMVFITAGMGGGTGTGAAPVIARIAKDQGILTVAVVTKPFQFEGAHRMRLAESGLKELQEYVDTLIIIPNQNLFRIANERTTFADAFKMADDVLHSGVRGVTDLMVKPGLINLDFADIRTVMREMGKAMMGTGEATGDRRAIEAAEAAISNPLLDDVSLRGARALLINITGGNDMTLFEVDEAANRIREEVDSDANIIFGSTFSDAMDGKMRVSVVATGIDAQVQQSSGGGAGGQKFTSSPEPKKPFAFAAATSAKAEYKPLPRPVSEPVRDATATAQAARPQVEQRSGGAVRVEKTPEQAVQASAAQEAAASRLRVSEYEQEELESRALPEMRHEIRPEVRNIVREQVVETVEQVEVRAVAGTRPQAFREPAREAAREPSKNFFQRMADVGRALSTRTEEAHVKPSAHERVHVVQKAVAAEVSEKPQKTAEEDQYLDIPAFLRRQAN